MVCRSGEQSGAELFAADKRERWPKRGLLRRVSQWWWPAVLW